MFEASLVNDKARTARPYTVSMSLVLQVTAAAAAVAYPLWHIEPLPAVKLRAMSPFRRAVELVDVQPQPRTKTPTYHKPLLEIPVLHARTEPREAVAFDAPVIESAATDSTGPFVLPGFSGPSTGGGLVAAPPPPTPKPPVVKDPAPAVPTHTGPVRVGGRVRQPQLIREVKPSYPALAVSARVQGVVRIEAIISRDGVIRDARVVSGHPLLVAAALDAVRQWRYRPTVLNDEAVEVALALEVNFTLSR